MNTSAVSASIDAAATLADARAELQNGTPSLRTLAALLTYTEELAAQLTDARTCPVTALPTRAAWLAEAESIVSAGPAVVVMIDLDAFKPVNDVHGHAVGDAVLKAMGQRLKNWATGRGGYAGRLGGDEFVIIVRAELMTDQARAALRETLTAPIIYQSIHLSVGASIGDAYVLGRDRADLSDALHQADKRMYREKGEPGRR